jgi:hypothetical protein
MTSFKWLVASGLSIGLIAAGLSGCSSDDDDAKDKGDAGGTGGETSDDGGKGTGGKSGGTGGKGTGGKSGGTGGAKADAGDASPGDASDGSTTDATDGATAGFKIRFCNTLTFGDDAIELSFRIGGEGGVLLTAESLSCAPGDGENCATIPPGTDIEIDLIDPAGDGGPKVLFSGLLDGAAGEEFIFFTDLGVDGDGGVFPIFDGGELKPTSPCDDLTFDELFPPVEAGSLVIAPSAASSPKGIGSWAGFRAESIRSTRMFTPMSIRRVH